MTNESNRKSHSRREQLCDRVAVAFLIVLILQPLDWAMTMKGAPRVAGRTATAVAEAPDTVEEVRFMVPVTPTPEGIYEIGDTIGLQGGDTLLTVVQDSTYTIDGKKIFNPDPTRAVWLSALLPGLGQVYNRRYWKLPIIIGGFMGLGYATNWNNNQFQDYSQGYRDLLDNDPDTRSYMNFFPPNTDESKLDKTWLTQTLKSRKDYYRRNRDLCIICIVGLYLLCMLDSYVDASLAHFDITPSLSMDVQPALLVEPYSHKAAVGLNWAFNF